MGIGGDGTNNEIVNGILGGAAAHTVFAPNNDAFDAVLALDESWTTPGDIPVETLETALDLHIIIRDNIREADLTDGSVFTLGGVLTVDATAKTLTDGSDPAVVSNILTTDIQATNGILHAIDNVLLQQIIPQRLF